MIKADFHVHSDYSTDSYASMESQIEAAISKGMERLCFTDHMDLDFPEQYGGGFHFDVPSYFEKIKALKKACANRITVLTGIEIGMQPYLADRYRELISQNPFDFVICSTHLVNGLDPYYPEFWESHASEESAVLQYLETTLANIEAFQDFDTYGHLDYIIRYAPSITFSYQSYEAIIDQILLMLIHYKKGIEVNTAGYKYGLGHANPHEAIINRYFELGGTYITIGSDAHKPEEAANDFPRALCMLKNLGIDNYAIFEARRSSLLPL